MYVYMNMANITSDKTKITKLNSIIIINIKYTIIIINKSNW